MRRLLLLALFVLCASAQFDDVEPAVRVVRFQVTYPSADLEAVPKVHKLNSLLRSSVLASLRFVNKHWLICGGTELEKKSNDCGKAQVTGEIFENKYRINATFISQRDPVKNAKIQATSTVLAVLQIGLRGGIFQYTNALKVLGNPSQELPFEDAFFCNRGYTLFDGDRCRKELVLARALRSRFGTRTLAHGGLRSSPQALAFHSDDGRNIERAAIDIAGLARL